MGQLIYFLSSFGAGVVCVWAMESGKDQKQRTFRFWITLLTFAAVIVGLRLMALDI